MLNINAEAQAEIVRKKLDFRQNSIAEKNTILELNGRHLSLKYSKIASVFRFNDRRIGNYVQLVQVS